MTAGSLGVVLLGTVFLDLGPFPTGSPGVFIFFFHSFHFFFVFLAEGTPIRGKRPHSLTHPTLSTQFHSIPVLCDLCSAPKLVVVAVISCPASPPWIFYFCSMSALIVNTAPVSVSVLWVDLPLVSRTHGSIAAA